MSGRSGDTSASGGTPVVIDNVDASRFEILVDGTVVGIADYVDRGASVELPHTVIDPSMRGRGLAAVLVEHALAAVRASGRTVIPTCWYVAQFLDERPDLSDLRAR